MTKINYVVSTSAELNECQQKVLKLLDVHPEHVFTMGRDDINDLCVWLLYPEKPEPPREPVICPGAMPPYSFGTIKWALSTLRAKGRIGSTEYNRKTYYGSHEAIKHLADIKEQERPKHLTEDKEAFEEYIKLSRPKVNIIDMGSKKKQRASPHGGPTQNPETGPL